MTFTEIRDEIAARLNLTSSEALDRLGRAVNRLYRSVTTTIGLETSRRVTVTADTTIDDAELTFDGIEKVSTVYDTRTGSNHVLSQVTQAQLLAGSPTAGDLPSAYAVTRMNAGSVTITLDQVPQSVFTLSAEGHERAETLSGSQEPAFSESFHDILIEGVLVDEYMKLEKAPLARIAKDTYEQRLSDLRMWISKSRYLDIQQNTRGGRRAL